MAQQTWVENDGSDPVAMGPAVVPIAGGATAGALNADLVPALDMSRHNWLKVQIAGTFVASVVAQGSLDGGVTWNTLTAILAGTGGTTQNLNTPGIYSIQANAPLIRVRLTSYTSGAAVLLGAEKIALDDAFVAPLASGGSIGTLSTITNPVPLNVVFEQPETTATLAGGATYTGTGRDLGITASARRTRVRSMIAHTAGLVPGHLILEQSTDNATWRETRRAPVPSDGGYHTFEWAVHMRYYRLRFINGATVQTVMHLHTIMVVAEGNTEDIEKNLNFPLSVTPLGAAATFNGPTLDLGFNHTWDAVRAVASSDQLGTLYIQESRDGATWRTIRPTYTPAGATVSGDGITIPANAGSAAHFEAPVMLRYVRAIVINGATAQASFDFNLALISL